MSNCAVLDVRYWHRLDSVLALADATGASPPRQDRARVTAKAATEIGARLWPAFDTTEILSH
jgi:hypothetical protein